MTLPSVRALKIQFGKSCETTQCENQTNSGCEKSKIIMNLNFSPVQFVAEQKIPESNFNFDFITTQKENLFYYKIFIPRYINSIWHPPKITYLPI